MGDAPILLVENEPDNATLTLFALTEAGVDNRVIVASDGLEALELLLAPSSPLSPALVLLDLAMPRMDGWETLRRLRADRRTASLPVVIISSSDKKDDVARLTALGADGYIHKSVTFERFCADLRATVRPFLSSKV
jgi:two-component system response regulator